MINQKHSMNVEYLNWLGNIVTDYAKCTHGIRYRISVSKEAFNKTKNLSTSKLDLNLTNNLVKCYIWSIALCGAETGTLRKVDQKYLGISKIWCWRRMEKVSWTDRVRNEEVLQTVK